MPNVAFTTLTRQQGLLQELQNVSNNLANASTTGYKADRAIFTELIVPVGENEPSLSIGALGAHAFEFEQGALRTTQGRFDFAIEGDGYFQVQTPNGNRLTRAGHFLLSNDGQLIDTSGNPVLGDGGAAITIPEDASEVIVARDGTISIDGIQTGRIGVFQAAGELLRDTSTYFEAQGGAEALEEPVVIQGALESSNVTPVLEVARLIEVQRAYEAGQSLLEQEDQRLTQLVSTIRDR